MGAVFSQLNKGEDITKSLRKVDKSEMTHKNPELRAGGVVASSTCQCSQKLQHDLVIDMC